MPKLDMTSDQIQEVDAARDMLHNAVLRVLRDWKIDSMNRDLSADAESIALEGYIDV